LQLVFTITHHCRERWARRVVPVVRKNAYSLADLPSAVKVTDRPTCH